MLKDLSKINKVISRISKKEKKLFYLGRFIPNTKLMFVAEMPSIPRNQKYWDPTDNFNLSHTDKKFIDLLCRYGFGGCYITDIVKTSNKVRRPTKDEIDKFFPLLLEEINILKPKYIIALGNSAFSILRKRMPNDQRILKIWHPAHQRSHKLYEKQIKDLP